MRIFYGVSDKRIDVTTICLTRLLHNNKIIIPWNDHCRSGFFTDPAVCLFKNIYIETQDIKLEIDAHTMVTVDLNTHKLEFIRENEIESKLQRIHSEMKMIHGDFTDEVIEQKMAAIFLTGNEKVLELGGNLGRNSLVISSILEDNKNLVTLESDSDIANQLKENRDNNKLHFNIESSALSKRKLIQHGWNTTPSDVLLDGYKWVQTVTFDELQSKYNIVFDTLVLDCEGAFYYILMDMPEILENINLIIVENDYHKIEMKEYVDNILRKNRFSIVFTHYGDIDPAYHHSLPCHKNFYEVWRRH